MATLLSLNQDVTFMILDLLPTGDLHALCLVHRSIHDAAERFLYSEIDLDWAAHSCSNACSHAKKHRNRIWRHPLIPLIRTLLQRPALAEYIRTVTFAPASVWKWGTMLGDPPLEKAMSLVAKSTLPYRTKWLEGLKAGLTEAYFAFLLTHLPKLQSLHIGLYETFQHDLLGDVLRSLLCPSTQLPNPSFTLPGSLQSLGKVTVDRTPKRSDATGAYWFQRTPAKRDLPFFYLPSVKELVLTIDDTDQGNLWQPHTPPSPTTSLVKLEIRDLKESHLAQVLSIAPRLQFLYWKWYCFESPDGRDRSDPQTTPTIDLDLLLPALSHVKDTLTELDIHAESLTGYLVPETGFANSRGTSRRIKGSFPGFSSFPALKKLSVPMVFLTGFEEAVSDFENSQFLPPNLEELTLTYDLYDTVRDDWKWGDPTLGAELIPWLEEVGKCTRNLRSLRLGFRLPADNNRLDDRSEAVRIKDRIKELAQEAGIELRLKDRHRQGGPWCLTGGSGWD